MKSLKSGWNSVVIGASGGIGSALIEAFRAQDQCANALGLSRSSSPPLDLLDEASIETAAAHAADTIGEIDVLMVATGVLTSPDGEDPEKSFSALSPESSDAIWRINALGPALVLKHFGPLMRKGAPSRIGVLSARVGSIGDNRLGGWMSYRASKAALNQMVRCAAVEIGRKRPETVCIALHPGTIETPLTRAHASGKYTHTPDACAS